ncbi:MAG: long-chain-fatty-acid--CoA ligase [Streptosporangiales bacterium]|nr:long-chain-fatty-acid--CoA ligase [Streptosporangiales bacterium]
MGNTGEVTGWIRRRFRVAGPPAGENGRPSTGWPASLVSVRYVLRSSCRGRPPWEGGGCRPTDGSWEGAVRLADFLDYWAREQPDAEFAVQGGRRISYREAVTVTHRLANFLIAAGLGPGDRAAVVATNSIEYLLLYFAAAKTGVALVPVNYRLTPDEWAYILGDSGSRVLFAGTRHVDALHGIRDRLETVERLVVLDGPGRPGWEDSAVLTEGPDTPPECPVDEDGDVYQMYTSGTTGRPKGVLLTNRAVTANIVQVALALDNRPGERCLAALPLYHAGIVPTVFAPLSRGGSLWILESFDPRQAVRVLSEKGIGYTTLVPSMIQMCLVEVPDVSARRYPALRLVHYGASPIAEKTLQTAMETFGCDFAQSYGLTEATQGVTFLSPADHRRALAGERHLLLAAGRPAIATEVRVVDEDDAPVPAGTTGEVVVRGPQLMRGYWRLPEESAATLRGGWLHTGDIGTLDEEGYLFVSDRLKDVIVSGGENVYPRTVENVLFRHPAVADAAVIGVPDERWGETVKAVVVAKADAAPTEEEIIGFCRERLAGFQRPRSVDFAEALPRNPSGKVLKWLLRERYWPEGKRRVGGA